MGLVAYVVGGGRLDVPKAVPTVIAEPLEDDDEWAWLCKGTYHFGPESGPRVLCPDLQKKRPEREALARRQLGA